MCLNPKSSHVKEKQVIKKPKRLSIEALIHSNLVQYIYVCSCHCSEEVSAWGYSKDVFDNALNVDEHSSTHMFI